MPLQEFDGDDLCRGDVVTVSYSYYSNHAVPVDPTIVRKRPDMTWDHVLGDYQRETAQAQKLNRKRIYIRLFIIQCYNRSFYPNDQHHKAYGILELQKREFADVF